MAGFLSKAISEQKARPRPDEGNGSYMVPEMVITSIVAALSYKPLKRYWLGEDLKAPKAI